ncbi:hypothetical protein L873DRAFT_1813779 [Choiromyces venosus 120613-1]|uniref:Uncharacterized protein n=1 Tax=Choiromyces venosus 120613-1 TaxID=1336337 RepID=A0A3N4JLI3_9PEZI|nr:hypothetical protein L873DRAFT_1813779 [Choiromyces venosus 120613-1]
MHPTTLFLPLLSRQHRYPTAIPTLQHPPAKCSHSPPSLPVGHATNTVSIPRPWKR